MRGENEGEEGGGGKGGGGQGVGGGELRSTGGPGDITWGLFGPVEDRPNSRKNGPDRDRTDDLHNAIVALSQLSYGPLRTEGRFIPVVWACHPPSLLGLLLLASL